MVSLDRRKLLGAIGAGSAGLISGGYWLLRDDDLDCPEYLDPAQEYTGSAALSWSRPVVDDETVFVGGGAGISRTGSGTDMFRLLAIDSMGELKWVARQELAGGIGAPRPTDEQVFASTGGNTLLALERSTGNLQWEFDAGNNEDSSMGMETLVHDDTVIAAVTQPDHDDLEADNLVIGVSADDGSIRWTVELADEVSRGLALVEETVVAATHDGTVVGIDPETGDQLWETALEAAPGWYDRPVSFADIAWVPRSDGVVVGLALESGAIEERLDGGRVADGEEHVDGGFVQVVRAIDDALIVSGADGTLSAYDDDRSERWRHDGTARAAGLIRSDERVAVLDQRGVYYELDEATGEFYREFSLIDTAREDGCGTTPSQEQFRGLVSASLSIVISGQRFGTKRYRIPASG
ncbi:outer membrane protein assembly factor BamB family protein [Halostagnicola bangensis]